MITTQNSTRKRNSVTQTLTDMNGIADVRMFKYPTTVLICAPLCKVVSFSSLSIIDTALISFHVVVTNCKNCNSSHSIVFLCSVYNPVPKKEHFTNRLINSSP